MSDSKYALYLWHIDKNMLINCKSLFNTKETWKTFYDNWHKVLYASTKPEFVEK